MAEKRISELTAKGSSLGANDLVEVSEYVSPGVYRTRYCTGTEVGGISSNFATADLTFTANRTHDISTYVLTFDGTTRVISPGATSGDTAFSIRNNTNTNDMVLVKGNGAININTFLLTTTQVGIKSNGSDYWILNLSDASNNSVFSVAGGECYIKPITAIGGSAIGGVQLAVYGKQRSISLPTYADNAAALAGGLVADDEYKTATGERRIVV